MEPTVQVKGEVLGRYELLLPLGVGGMARVYLARQHGPEGFQKLLAVKRIHDHLLKDPEYVEMFLDEARLSARIVHRNVVQVFDLGQADATYFIAMEYVHGHNLLELLDVVTKTDPEATGPGYRWGHAVRIVADAAAGLHAAHELRNARGELLGLVHRDLAPQNILVSYDGFAKVVDFGVAFARERSSETAAGRIKGTISYMSPEQAAGERVDRRSDVYALGNVLFDGVCLRSLYRERLRRLFRERSVVTDAGMVWSTDLPRPSSIQPEIPLALERIILRALARDPDERYQTAQELHEALEELLLESDTHIGPPELGALLRHLFAHEKAQRDEEIRRVWDRLEAGWDPDDDETLEYRRSGGSPTTVTEPTDQERRELAAALAARTGTVKVPGPYDDKTEETTTEFRKGAVDEEFELAVTAPSVPDIPPVSTSPPAPRAPAPPVEPSSPGVEPGQATWSRKALWLYGAVAVVVVALSVVLIASLGDEKPTQSDARPAAGEQTQRVTLTFLVLPHHARVFVDAVEAKQDQGKEWRVLRVAAGERAITIRATADGYLPLLTSVRPDRDQTVTLRLERLKQIER